MNISNILNHEGYQKYIRPTLIGTGIILAVATVALAILLVAPELLPTLALNAKLSLLSSAAFLSVIFLGATRQENAAPPSDIPAYGADRAPLVVDDRLLGLVYTFLEQIICRDYQVEGPFRIPGNRDRIRTFINQINISGPPKPIPGFDIHDACSALKQLVSRTNSTVELAPSELNLEAAVTAYYALPSTKRELVRRSLNILTFLKDNHNVTKMDAKNLAIAANSLLITTTSLKFDKINALAEEMINNQHIFN